MSTCCSTPTDNRSKITRKACPVCTKNYQTVSIKTILQHIKTPWYWQATASTYYFCGSPTCDVVYYGADDSLITQAELRTSVALKQASSTAIVCYCFGISAQAVLDKADIRQFIVEQTKQKQCACEIRNPSGKCCLKYFPKQKNKV